MKDRMHYDIRESVPAEASAPGYNYIQPSDESAIKFKLLFHEMRVVNLHMALLRIELSGNTNMVEDHDELEKQVKAIGVVQDRLVKKLKDIEGSSLPF